MKKILIIFMLLGGVLSATAQSNPDKALPEEPKKEKLNNSAIWIAVGVVIFVSVIAARNRRRRN